MWYKVKKLHIFGYIDDYSTSVKTYKMIYLKKEEIIFLPKKFYFTNTYEQVP